MNIKKIFTKEKTPIREQEKQERLKFGEKIKGFFTTKKEKKSVKAQPAAVKLKEEVKVKTFKKLEKGSPIKEKKTEKKFGEKIKLGLKKLKAGFEEKIEKPVAEVTQKLDQKLGQLERIATKKLNQAEKKVDSIIKDVDTKLQDIQEDLKKAANKGEKHFEEALDKAAEKIEVVVSNGLDKLENTAKETQKENKSFFDKFIPGSLKKRFQSKPKTTTEKTAETIKDTGVKFKRWIKRGVKSLKIELGFKKETVGTVKKAIPVLQKLSKISKFIDKVRKMFSLMGDRVKNFFEDLGFYNKDFITALKGLKKGLTEEFWSAFS